MTDCPLCAEKILAKAKLCKHCGSKVDPVYVSDKKLNKQICKLIDFVDDGQSFQQVCDTLNGTSNFRLDTGKEWNSHQVEEVYIEFTKVKSIKRRE